MLTALNYPVVCCRVVSLHYFGRSKLFQLDGQTDQLIAGIRNSMKALALEMKAGVINAESVQRAKLDEYNATGAPLAVFDVIKFSSRHPRPVSRQLQVTEKFVVEKDSSGFSFVSFHAHSDVYAIVRSWRDPREFKVSCRRCYTVSNGHEEPSR